MVKNYWVGIWRIYTSNCGKKSLLLGKKMLQHLKILNYVIILSNYCARVECIFMDNAFQRLNCQFSRKCIRSRIWWRCNWTSRLIDSLTIRWIHITVVFTSGGHHNIIFRLGGGKHQNRVRGSGIPGNNIGILIRKRICQHNGCSEWFKVLIHFCFVWTIVSKILLVTNQTWITRFPFLLWRLIVLFIPRRSIFLLFTFTFLLTSWLLIFAFGRLNDIDLASRSRKSGGRRALDSHNKSRTRWSIHWLLACKTNHVVDGMWFFTKRLGNNIGRLLSILYFIVKHARLGIDKIQILGTRNYFLFSHNSTLGNVFYDGWKQRLNEPFS